jgi:hypothetical protein
MNTPRKDVLSLAFMSFDISALAAEVLRSLESNALASRAITLTIAAGTGERASVVRYITYLISLASTVYT